MKTGPLAKTATAQEAVAARSDTSVLGWRTGGAGSGSLSGIEVLGAYAELVKPRLTTLILLVMTAGFWLASPGALNGGLFRDTTLAIALLASGIFALNQYMERDLDALMRRTAGRPLPTSRLQPAAVLLFGLATSAFAFALLAIQVNVLTAALAGFTFGTYVLVYTPLKRRTPHCTFWGAVPGAMPPLIGWAAATGELTVGAAVLFLILFCWQFPHFHAIGWLYREDYGRAGIKMWTVVEPDGKMMGREIIGYALLLVPVSALPAFMGISGSVYLAGALLLGMGLLYLSFKMALQKSKQHARRLLIASVIYLPVLFALMVLDK